jgi:DNA/RNA endonuclease YhcR with UshA esterase domain
MALKASMLSLVGAAVLATALPAAAHHSIAAEFDTNKPVTFTGTVKAVEWTNPHTYTQVEVKNPDGTATVYRVEGGPPNALFRQGWRKDSLKTGETVTVKGLRAKNANSMNVGQATITTSDGRTMFGQTNSEYRQ